MNLYRVKAFGCGNLQHDEEGFATQPSCKSWCGDQDKCVMVLRNVANDEIQDLLDKDWCGSLENWWAQATDEQKKSAYSSSISADTWKAKRIRELEDDIPLFATPVAQWISVDERLPEAKTYVLVYDEYREFTVAFLSDGRFYQEVSCEEVERITHWQPLPAAPETTPAEALKSPT